MNIDYATRRSAPWPVQVAERLSRCGSAPHLPKPAKAGRVMGLTKTIVVLSERWTSRR